MVLIDLLIIIIIIGPFVNLLSLFGSIYFILIFGGNYTATIGGGKPVFRLINIEVRSWYFYGHEYFWKNLKFRSVLSKVLIVSGGMIFKVVLLGILIFLINQHMIILERYAYYVIIVTIIYCIIEIPRLNIFLRSIYLDKKLDELEEDFKNPEWYIRKVDKMLIPLKNLISQKHDNVMKRLYLIYVINKASVLIGLGDFEESIKTLKDINIEEFSIFHSLNFLYYNNLIYSLAFTKKLEEAELAYNQLIALSDEIDLNKNKELAFKDTIATYEFFKGNFEESQKKFEEIISEQPNKDHVTSLYFLSQIYNQKGNDKQAINLLSNIDMSKVRPFLFDRIKEAKAELGI